MVTDLHSTSRRSVIGALAAAPIRATASVVEAAATGGALTDWNSGMNMRARISKPARDSCEQPRRRHGYGGQAR